MSNISSLETVYTEKRSVTRFLSHSFFLKAERSCYDLSSKRCSKACIFGNKPRQTKNMKNYFCLSVSYYLMQDSFFTTSPLATFYSRNINNKHSDGKEVLGSIRAAYLLHHHPHSSLIPPRQLMIRRVFHKSGKQDYWSSHPRL